MENKQSVTEILRDAQNVYTENNCKELRNKTTYWGSLVIMLIFVGIFAIAYVAKKEEEQYKWYAIIFGTALQTLLVYMIMNTWESC